MKVLDNDQECMMTSFLLQRKEEEHITAKNSNKAESPVCTKIEPTFPKGQFHNSVNKIWTLQAYLASYSYTGMVVGPS